MEKRHLFERELQQEALQEFDALARIKELVDYVFQVLTATTSLPSQQQ